MANATPVFDEMCILKKFRATRDHLQFFLFRHTSFKLLPALL
jgi:hypothetical protein